MNAYFVWKLIHILSATVLFGTGIGSAAVMLFAHRTKNLAAIAAVNQYVVMADWVFTASTAILQPLSGFAMMWIVGYPFTLFWIMTSIVLYLFAISCWLVVVYLQIQLRDMAREAFQSNSTLPARYFKFFNIWFYLGWPAFILFLIIFYLMVFKPAAGFVL